MSKKKWRLNKAGRPRDPDAKHHQTTREGRRSLLGPTPELLHRRLALTGNQAGTDYPPDVLFTQKLITGDQRDEALRFSMLAWWLYGSPTASCAAVYERMVAEGFGGGDFAPRSEGETDEDRLRRLHGQKARFHRMLEALGALERGEIETAGVGRERVVFRARRFVHLRGTPFAAVRQATQFLEMPPLVAKLAAGEVPAAADFQHMAMLTEGLQRLVAARGAEDRHWRRKRAELVRELGLPK